MSEGAYRDIGFCLECAYQHARDVEHHLEDAVKFGKSHPERQKFQELLDKQRLIRKEIDKLRLKQLMETGEEICIACSESESETESGNPESESNPESKIPVYCEFIKEQVKPKEYFDPRSFRTVCPESPTKRCKDLPPEMACASRIIIGCPKGFWDEETQRCRVGTEVHVIYHGKPKP